MWQIMSEREVNLRLGVAFKGCPGVGLRLSGCVSGFRPAHIFLPLLSPEGAHGSHMWAGRAELLIIPSSRGTELELCGPGTGMKTEGFS